MSKFNDFFLRKTIHDCTISGVISTVVAFTALGGIVTNKISVKDASWLLLGTGIASSISAIKSIGVSSDTKYILNDYDDVSAQVRTNQLYEELQEPNIQEYNWQVLNSVGYPISILGDRDKALKLASWLSSKSGTANSIMISDCSSDVAVVNYGQLIIPGNDVAEYAFKSMIDYSVSMDYPATIKSLNSHTVRLNNDFREGVIASEDSFMVLLDEPPSMPILAPNVYSLMRYVVIGTKGGDAWVTVLLGEEAIDYADKNSASSPVYWSTVTRRWMSGEYPVLVNGRYAKLPFC
jgi:hypothetical protein